jgi:isopenicillin N synthase-like dioxygenase
MIQVTDIRLASKQTAFSEIPIIDIASLVDGSDPQGVARKIGEACEKVGFFYIKNHGVPKDLVERLYSLTRKFFDLPFEAKDRLNVVNSGQTLRGYIPMYAENVDPHNTRDFKECFDFGSHEEAVSPFFGPNQMPEETPEFGRCCEEYHNNMLELARKLISAIALSLDLSPDYFQKLQRKPITIQRLLHYPPQVGEVTQEEIGIGAHTDYGFLTILFQDQVGGLQVRNRAGEWVSAPPVENTFVVNIGEFNEAHEGIDLRIVAYDHVKDYRKLECDLAVYYSKSPPEAIKSTPICSEEIFPICSPAYLARHRGLATPQDLADCTWLWLDESERDWVSWTEWFRRLGHDPVTPRNKINLNNYSMVIQAALSGQGVALGWRNLVDPYLKAGTLVRPIPDTLQTEGQFFVLEPSGPHERRKSVASFRDWLLSLE